MNHQKNISVSFRSDTFNSSDPKDYFINPCCFGDDLATWLMQRLRERGFETKGDKPDQEDFGWYFNFSFEGVEYTCLVIYDEGEKRWLCILEYNAGFIALYLVKGRKRFLRNRQS